jgi:hypothetical protein
MGQNTILENLKDAVKKDEANDAALNAALDKVAQMKANLQKMSSGVNSQ